MFSKGTPGLAVVRFTVGKRSEEVKALGLSAGAGRLWPAFSPDPSLSSVMWSWGAGIVRCASTTATRALLFGETPSPSPRGCAAEIGSWFHGVRPVYTTGRPSACSFSVACAPGPWASPSRISIAAEWTERGRCRGELMFWGARSSKKCFLDPGAVLGGAAPCQTGSLCSPPGHPGRPLAEASAGQQAAGALETLRAVDPWVQPTTEGAGPPHRGSQPGRSTAPSFWCLLSSGFWWREALEEVGGRKRALPQLDLGVNPDSASPWALELWFLQGESEDSNDLVCGTVLRAQRGSDRLDIFISILFLFLLTRQQAPAGAERSRKWILEGFPFLAAFPGIFPKGHIKGIRFRLKAVVSAFCAAQGGRAEGRGGQAGASRAGW